MNDGKKRVRGPYRKYLINPDVAIPRTTSSSQIAKNQEENVESNFSKSESTSAVSSSSPEMLSSNKKKRKRKRKKIYSKSNSETTSIDKNSFNNDGSEKIDDETDFRNDKYPFIRIGCNSSDESDTETTYSLESDNDVEIASDENSDIEYEDSNNDEEAVNESHLDDDEPSDGRSLGDTTSNSEEEQAFIYEGSRITEQQSRLLSLAFSLRHSLPDVGLENLVSLLDCHLSTDVLKSKYHITKNDSPPEIIEHYYCENCSEILSFNGTEDAICKYCNQTFNKVKLKKDGMYFVTMPLKRQVEELVNGDLSDKFRNSCEESDVINGHIYKNMKEKQLISENDISIQVNVDGVSLSKSSKASLWPILVTVNELPYRLRKKNVLICGLWFGEKKPPLNMYLKPIVDELTQLCEEGIERKIAQDHFVKVKLHTLLFPVDSVARAMLQNLKQFNGSYGCPYCMHKGERIAVGRGFSRIYCYAKKADRTHRKYQRHLKRAVASGKVVRGVKGPSIISSIPNIHVILSCPPDYMHCWLLGVAKLFGKAWFDPKNSNRPFYLGSHVKQFNERLLLLQPPCEITRTPRPITDNYKANEWKSFLLYFSIACLKGLLPETYLKHWNLLVIALHLLLKEKISREDLLLAKHSIDSFVKDIKTLYGEHFLRFNVHLLLHLCKFVELYGALWAWSTFPFEGFNGVIRHLYFGTQYVPLQISKLYCRLRYLRNQSFIFNGDDVNPKVLNTFLKLMNQCKVSNCIDYGSDLRTFGKAITIDLSVTEKNVIEKKFRQPIDDTCHGFDRFIYKNILFHSKNYSRLRKRNNSVILTNEGAIFKIARILIVTSHNSGKTKYIIIGFKYKILEEVLCKTRENNIDSDRYCYVATETKTIICAEVESILSKCVDIAHPDSGKRCVFPIVNTFETD